mmetsp:Transcript_51971/g.123728  ORF Transcript_51971/g.123728 Transcript_51971/m.123728 type:complete len:247 (+) Transcript_51971:457-1197(+)
MTSSGPAPPLHPPHKPLSSEVRHRRRHSRHPGRRPRSLPSSPLALQSLPPCFVESCREKPPCPPRCLRAGRLHPCAPPPVCSTRHPDRGFAAPSGPHTWLSSPGTSSWPHPCRHSCQGAFASPSSCTPGPNPCRWHRSSSQSRRSATSRSACRTSSCGRCTWRSWTQDAGPPHVLSHASAPWTSCLSNAMHCLGLSTTVMRQCWHQKPPESRPCSRRWCDCSPSRGPLASPTQAPLPRRSLRPHWL